MNEGLDAGKSRFVLDLHAMERLVLELRALAGDGRHGGVRQGRRLRQVRRRFGPLGGRLHSVLEEGRARSAYRFPGVGEIAFVRDGDATDLCVAMASIVGKYLREVLMARVVRYYRDGRSPTCPTPAATTTRSRPASSTRRASPARGASVPDGCFERRGAEG